MVDIVWDLDISKRVKRLTWWWWFWLFFIKNEEDPSHPKQLMILWSTKNCNKIKVNDILWKKPKDIQKRDGELDFNGMVAAWYYDGKKMIDPLLLKKDDFHMKFDENEGSLTSKSDCTFNGNKDKYEVKIKNGDLEFDFDLSPAGILSEQDLKEHYWYKKFGYNIIKIRKMNLTGSIKTDSKKEDITGSAYFQRVTVNAPAPPWYWGTIHMRDGSYLQYFLPHIGFSALRRTEKSSSILDYGYVPVRRSMEFYDKNGNKYDFKKVHVAKKMNRDGFPVFKVVGKDEERILNITLDAYSRAFWRFESRLLFYNSILHYNEYPVNISDFNFENGKEKLSMKDIGGGVGNCEYSWGLMI